MNAGGMLNTCKSNEAFVSYLYDSKDLVADGWGTRKNLPLGGGQQLETVANTPYAEEWNGENRLGTGLRLISLLVR